MEFKSFSKIPRMTREMVITEKIDGTNGIIAIADDTETMYVGSRNQWLAVISNSTGIINAKMMSDNAGFAKWAVANFQELLKLGPGYHYGEWWGGNIQRGYDLKEKRFSLFNVGRWVDPTSRPACCHIVPILFVGTFCTDIVDNVLESLRKTGSVAAPGFMRPEGVIVYHKASGCLFKKTIEKDEQPKNLP